LAAGGRFFASEVWMSTKVILKLRLNAAIARIDPIFDPSTVLSTPLQYMSADEFVEY
jgi:hypothetical protein